MFKILFLVSLICCALAQTTPEPRLTCTYVEHALGYGCNIEFENANGSDDWTTISGVHLEGRTDADVTVIMSSSGITRNVPQV